MNARQSFKRSPSHDSIVLMMLLLHDIQSHCVLLNTTVSIILTVIVDETRMHHYDPELKQQTSQWENEDLSLLRKMPR